MQPTDLPTVQFEQLKVISSTHILSEARQSRGERETTNIEEPGEDLRESQELSSSPGLVKVGNLWFGRDDLVLLASICVSEVKFRESAMIETLQCLPSCHLKSCTN